MDSSAENEKEIPGDSNPHKDHHIDSQSTEMTMEISGTNLASSSRMVLDSSSLSDNEDEDDKSHDSTTAEAMTEEERSAKRKLRKTRFRGITEELSQESLSISDLADDSRGPRPKMRRPLPKPAMGEREESLNSLTGGSTRSLSHGPGNLRRFFSRNSLLPRSDSASDRDSMYNKPPSLEQTESTTSSPLRRFRLLCGSLVEAPSVQLTIIVLIIINALFMGVGTFDFVTEDPDMDRKFDIVDRTFLTIFTIELGLQLIYRGVFLFLDGWLVFDFVIVVTSWSLESLQIIRAFRIFRAFRLITRIGPLRELVMALGNVMPRLNAIFFMLCLVFYIYAVLFTVLFGELELSEKYFDTLFHSLFTCMELMTLEWASIAREVIAQKSWAWFVFLSYISITGFIVFNLIVAVVCDAVAIVDQQVKAEQEAEDKAERERQGIDEPEEVDLVDTMNGTQIRIYELSKDIDQMKSRHRAMAIALSTFAFELHELEAIDE